MSDDITIEIYEYLEQKEQFKTYQEARLWCATGLIEFKVYDFNTNLHIFLANIENLK